MNFHLLDSVERLAQLTITADAIVCINCDDDPVAKAKQLGAFAESCNHALWVALIIPPKFIKTQILRDIGSYGVGHFRKGITSDEIVAIVTRQLILPID